MCFCPKKLNQPSMLFHTSVIFFATEELVCGFIFLTWMQKKTTNNSNSKMCAMQTQCQC